MSRAVILSTFVAAAVAAMLAAPAFGTGAPPSEPRFVGEAKNELPFTRPVGDPPTIVVSARDGFAWRDGAIGALAGGGLGLAAGAVAAARRSRRARVSAPALLTALEAVPPTGASASWASLAAHEETVASPGADPAGSA